MGPKVGLGMAVTHIVAHDAGPPDRRSVASGDRRNEPSAARKGLGHRPGAQECGAEEPEAEGLKRRLIR